MFAASSTQLFKNWKAWCDENNEHPATHREFSQTLEARGYRRKHARTGTVFFGLALKAGDDKAAEPSSGQAQEGKRVQ